MRLPEEDVKAVPERLSSKLPRSDEIRAYTAARLIQGTSRDPPMGERMTLERQSGIKTAL
jgi:hypothetical protein